MVLATRPAAAADSSTPVGQPLVNTDSFLNDSLLTDAERRVRDTLGGNGIRLEYHGARHFSDVEAVYTYEGTDTMPSLILEREIIGVQALAPHA